MRKILSLLALLITISATAQTDNKLPFMRFWGQMAIGKNDYINADTTSWVDIGPATGGKKGVLLARVQDTALLTMPKPLALTVFQIKDSSYYSWVGNKWKALGSVISGISDVPGLQPALNAKVNYTDTAAMLANYQTGINARVKYTDTANMLLKYLRQSDAAATYAPVSGSGNYINNQNSVAQTANAWLSGQLKLGSLSVGGNPKLGIVNSGLIFGYTDAVTATCYGKITGGQFQMGTVGHVLAFGQFDNGANTFTENGRLDPSGNWLFGTTTNNGADKIQVTGSISASTGVKVGAVTSDASYSFGLLQARADINKLRAHLGGAIQNLATETWVQQNATISGHVIYVDKDAPNATDTRAGISNYSRSAPFKSIQAAVNAAVGGDVVKVLRGTYNETVTNPLNTDYKLVYENVFHNGGGNSAINFSLNNAQFELILINSTITNSGTVGNEDNTAALRVTGAGSVNISGSTSPMSRALNGSQLPNSYISSTNADAMYLSLATGQAASVSNLYVTSSNYRAIVGGTAYNNVNSCVVNAPNGSGIYSSAYVINSYIKAKDYCVYGNSGPILNRFENCYFESTAGNAIYGGNLGSDNFGGVIRNCSIKSYNEALSMTSGNPSISYSFFIERSSFEITNATNTFAFPNSGTLATSLVDVYDCRSNKTIAQTLSQVTFNDIQNTVNSSTKVYSGR